MAHASPVPPPTGPFHVRTTGTFDAGALVGYLEEMTKEKKDIHWKAFTQVCSEMTLLVASMGSVFHFAAADVRHNVGVMCCHYMAFDEEAGGAPLEPGSTEDLDAGVRLTLDYTLAREARDGTMMQNDYGYIAITFTVRHLLWTLDFVHEILRRVVAEDGANRAKEMGQIVREAYNDSLRQYHGFLLRQTFSAACSMLPYRKTFEEGLAGGASPEESLVRMRRVTELVLECKEAVWELYRKRDIVPEKL